MVLSETRARWRGLTLVLVIRGGLRSVECLGETAGQANTLAETSPRTIGSDRARTSRRSSVLSVVLAERYVVCNVSFVGSQSSPFFHKRSAIEAIFRASVTLANSGLVPWATHAS
jgi:hypothetical protein